MGNKQRMVEEFCTLVAIDAPSLKERKIADELIHKLIMLGFDVKEDDSGGKIGGNCGNLYGYLPGDESKEPILLVAHMDTVEPANGKRAIVHSDGKITSDRATVLGADDVAGIVSILEAVRSVKEMGENHRPIEVLFTVAEELFTLGCSVMDTGQVKSKEAYILDLDGTVGTAAYRAPSILTFSIAVQGKAAHAGFAPETGIHAIAIAAELITMIKQGHVDEDTTVNVGTIEGGIARNVVPDYCQMQGEIRGFDNNKALVYRHHIHQLAESIVRKHGASLLWEEEDHCIAYKKDEFCKTIENYETVCRKLGIESRIISTFGGSDCNVLNQRGIDALVISNGMNRVHSCEEFTTIEELEKSCRVLEELILL